MFKRISYLIVVSFLLLTSCQNETKPNIVIINIDDLGFKDLGYTGSTYYETPNIDFLASQGMVFNNGYAASANCAPSRASLMTGKWVQRHGIFTVGTSERGSSKDRKIIPIKNTTTLSKAHVVLPEVLKENGYTTCHAGKWHLSDNPLEYGFNINIAGGHNGHPKSYYPPYKNVKIEEGKNEYLTDLIMEKAVNFIKTTKEPFFLNYSPYAVHNPINPVNKLLKKYKNKPESHGQNNAGYASMIENLDRNIGLLINSLKENNRFENTLIVFTSDNGGLFGNTNQHPLRAGKGSYYEGGIRVPFFFVWKNNIKKETINENPISNLDLYPTLLKAAGIEAKEVDGTNILPILKGKKAKLDRALFWHFPVYLEAYNKNFNENRDSLFRTRPGSVVRHGDWKLHYYFENNEIELFNLKNDIGEKENLAETNIPKKEELLGLLNKWWKETNAPIPTQLNPDFK